MRDEKAVLSVSTLLTGQYGIADIFLSLPCILGAAGVERVLSPDLTDDERAGLLASASVLTKALMALDAA